MAANTDNHNSPGWWVICINSQVLVYLLVSIAGCASNANGRHYRGVYTLGHEVNTFCPQSGSQCYWLAPGTSRQVRDQLRTIYQQASPGLYRPVCISVSGEIDTDSERTGFAADFDGLITIKQVHGLCDPANEKRQK